MQIWALCDAETFYCCNCQVYTGKVGQVREKGQAKRVVHDLSDHLHTGYNVTMDNYFTSISLAHEFLLDDRTLVGTLRVTKDVPQEMLSLANRTIGSAKYCYTAELTLLSLKVTKKKVVLLLSTQHGDSRNVIHTGRDGKEKSIPEIVNDYNATKGGVDTMDEMLKAYRSYKRSARYTVVLFSDMIDICALNAYVCYLWHHQEWNSTRTDKRRQFLMDLSMDLIRTEVRRRDTIGLQSSILSAMSSVLGEPVEVAAAREATAATEKSRCHLCCRTKDRKTARKCMECERFVCAEHSNRYYICDSCADRHEESD